MRTVCCASCLTGLLLVGSFSVRAEVEYLDYIDTTGTQWVDTGILGNPKRCDMEAKFAVLEQSETRVGLFGAYNFVNQLDSWEGGGLTSMGCSFGKQAVSGIGTHYRLYPDWTGSAGSGYVYPAASDLPLNTVYTYKSHLATAYVNGGKNGGGYYDGNVKDYEYAAGKTLYIGNVNNAGNGCYTAEGSMPKIRWYAFRVWRDGTLVGEFLPAKDGATVGFYDTVTQKMFASESEDAFVEPVTFVWKGGGDTAAWTDGSNWEGGVAPGKNIVRIPAGCKAVAGVSDLDTLNGYTRIELLGDDTTLSLSNLYMSADKVLTVPLRGKGTFLIEDGRNEAVTHLRLSADNRRFTGNVRIEGVALSIKSAKALGTGGTLTANLKGGQYLELDFSASEGVISNTCYFKGGTVIPGYFAAPEIAGDVHIMGGMTLRGYNNYLTLSGHLYRDVNCDPSFGLLCFKCPDLNLSGTSGTAWMGGNKKIGGYVKSFGTSYAENTWTFVSAHALSPKFGGGTRLGTNSATFTADLNGYDQEWGRMYWHSDDQYEANCAITSTRGPAKLTVCGDLYTSWGTTHNVFGGRVQGQASFELNSTNSSTAATVMFGHANSQTTGGFTARRGTIELLASATFSNVTHLVATSTGLLKVHTADIGNNTNLCVKVEDATTAKISIDSGLTLKADTAYMGTKWLVPGKYSSVASEGVTACSQLAGTGILDVRNYGGKKGLVILLR